MKQSIYYFAALGGGTEEIMADTAKNVYIVLEDGHIFSGKRFGAEGDVCGELVFTTGMGGYIETITDPSYYGQIVVQTFPLIGNYGMISQDKESEKPALFGYVVRDLCDAPSNFRTETDLDTYLKDCGIVGVCGVDTREITKIIRESGVMNAKIVSEIPPDLSELKEYAVRRAVESVSCGESYVVEPSGEKKHRVALLDLGAKRNIIRELTNRGCSVTVLPHTVAAAELCGYDGVMLSNGPGDPAENTEVIETIKQILGKTPIFGICLGHQLLALANGAKTEKLKYGHRGANQPVKDTKTNRVYISSQNHGYAVVSKTLPEYARESYINANDFTCEGVDYDSLGAFSVQFHPEACSGPKDTNFLFDRFISMLGGSR